MGTGKKQVIIHVKIWYTWTTSNTVLDMYTCNKIIKA